MKTVASRCRTSSAPTSRSARMTPRDGGPGGPPTTSGACCAVSAHLRHPLPLAQRRADAVYWPAIYDQYPTPARFYL